MIRNKLIARVFYDMGYIEKYGSGTIKIIDLCKRHGLPSPEFKEVSAGFSVVFRKDVYTEEYLHNLGLNERQIKAVMYVKEKGRITNTEYQELTKISRQMATIDLAETVKRGVFNKIGKAGKGIAYQLTELTNK